MIPRPLLRLAMAFSLWFGAAGTAPAAITLRYVPATPPR